jgi:hypothetical protein
MIIYSFFLFIFSEFVIGMSTILCQNPLSFASDFLARYWIIIDLPEGIIMIPPQCIKQE